MIIATAILLMQAAAAVNQPAAIWRDTGPIEKLDLAAGPGGMAHRPSPPFTFDHEETRGTAPKVVVKDSKGVSWMVKFGPEVKAECFASRFAWAAGYVAQPTYFEAEGNILKVGKLKRAKPYLDAEHEGHFQNARFQLMQKPGSGSWDLQDSPISKTKELSGLKLVVLLLSNWDMKRPNRNFVELDGKRFYAISDWGASMGDVGGLPAESKWNCEGYAKQSVDFVDGLDGEYLTFNYAGKEVTAVTDSIRVQDVKWFMSRMEKLKDEQIRAGLKASGATPAEVECFTSALRKRLSQLSAVTNDAAPQITKKR